MSSYKKEIFSLFKKRDENANKGNFGRALLICGSYSLAGAAIIAGKAAIKSGIGICDIACEKSVYEIVSCAVPEAVCTPLSKEFTNEDKMLLKEKIKCADVIVIGCGMGNTDYTDKILRLVVSLSNVPIIIDADGLNVLSSDMSVLKEKKQKIIVTPHPAEMGRLVKKSAQEVNKDRVLSATSFSKEYDVVTLLKGRGTVISDENGEYVINESGSVGMATGGSGDMLCGIIAAFIGEGMSVFDATRAAAYIHGLAGEISAKEYSIRSTSATTMLEMLPKIYLQIEE
ncbi:MAG: NAD(P)H-hydrate dehydratase [Clostridia bacterium]|nr:NAD(P)H-hydrate dehydratase [Clostridia bacterium]